MSKYGDHLRLKGQESIFECMGLPIARSKMWDSLRAGPLLLKPVVDQIRELVVESEVIWTGDTVVKLRIVVEAAALNRRLPESRVWAYRGEPSSVKGRASFGYGKIEIAVSERA